jgi:hypothetical protein
LTHIYFYSLIFPVDTGGVLGAIFPDTNLLTGFRWAITHKNTVSFHDSLSPDERASFLSFAWGMMTHGVDSEGLDYYGDEKYGDFEKGYAYFKGREIVDDVIRACRVPPEIGLWKAHNFIEMAIENLVVRRQPRLSQWAETAFRDEDYIGALSLTLPRFYPLDASHFQSGITRFKEFIIPSGDPLELGKSYAKVLQIRHGITGADPLELAGIIEKAGKIIEGEYFSFILECRNRFIERWGSLINEEFQPG